MADYYADDVLVNKLGITDPIRFKTIEQKVVAEKSAELVTQVATATPDVEYFKLIHKRLFEDLYDFAGAFRTVDIVKPESAAPFAHARFVDSEATRIFNQLAHDKYLVGYSKESFIMAISSLSVELNALHPFRDGNGRTIRLYLILLGLNAGYLLDYSQVSASEIVEADILAFKGDDRKLVELHSKIITPGTT